MAKLAYVAMAGALGCGAGDDPGAALPRASELQIGVPAGAASSTGGGEPAMVPLVAYTVSQQLNGLCGSLIGQMDSIRSTPPTATGDGGTIWGPFTPA